MATDLLMDGAAVREALRRRGIPLNESWKLTVRGGSAVRRALRGGTLRREVAEQLATALHVGVEQITHRGDA